jgi:hypothetical protein
MSKACSSCGGSRLETFNRGLEEFLAQECGFTVRATGHLGDGDFTMSDSARSGCGLTMRCSGRRASSRRLQGQDLARAGWDQQAARRLRAAADRGR